MVTQLRSDILVQSGVSVDCCIVYYYFCYEKGTTLCCLKFLFLQNISPMVFIPASDLVQVPTPCLSVLYFHPFLIGSCDDLILL